MENGFKVGDKVIAKKDKLDSAKGKIGVITQIFPDIDLCIVKYKDEIAHNCGLVSDEWPFRIANIKSANIESENPSIHIYPNKYNTNETIAILKQGKEVIKTASTICNPTDKYDFNKGAEIAFNRLLRILDLSTITNEQLIAELTNRLGGK